jgi:hypothetical protein
MSLHNMCQSRPPSRKRRSWVFIIASGAILRMIAVTLCRASDEMDASDAQNVRQSSQSSQFHADTIEDSFLDPLSSDPSCSGDEDCYAPPKSTKHEDVIELDVITTKLDATCFKGGEDMSEEEGYFADSFEKAVERQQEKCIPKQQIAKERKTIRIDKHWGKDPDILAMRDTLLNQSRDSLNDSRPPIFLLPGLASTRLGEYSKLIEGVHLLHLRSVPFSLR